MRLRWAMALGTLAGAAAVLLLRDPAPVFVYDAAQYWAGSQAITEGTDVYALGGLNTRGVLTALVYVPAYAATQALGGSAVAGAWSVLVQNAVLVGVAGGVLVPLLLRQYAAIGPLHIAASTVLTTLVLSGFAPYPLMDLAAVFGALAALTLLFSSSLWPAVAGGFAIAAAMNLRPAYALSAGLVLLVVLIGSWRRGALALAGAAVALGAQVVYGHRRAGTVSVWPPDTSLVTDIQLAYSAYGVRYDTVPYLDVDPRQWYCSPDMASAVAGSLPMSNGELLSTFVQELPTSAWFALQKVTSALYWSWDTPYSGDDSAALRPLGLLVVLVVAAGTVTLIRLALSAGPGRPLSVAVLGLHLGTCVTLVASSPEARFAAPIVAAGVVGLLAVTIPRDPPPDRSAVIRYVAGVVVVAVGVCLLGGSGLRDPAPPGDVTAEICRVT